MQEGVFDQVNRRVRARKPDRDDPRRRHEAKQHENNDFAVPEKQHLLEHGDGALPVRAFLRDPPVHRQHAEQRETNNKQCGEW